MKKTILSILMVVLVTVMLFAGGQAESAEKEKTTELPDVTWKFSHTQAPGNFIDVSAHHLAEYVAEKTGGKFKIEVYPSGTLGWEREVLESMQLGTLAMTFASASPYSSFVPAYNFYSLPGLFKSTEQLAAVFNDEAIQSKLMKASAEKGLLPFGTTQSQFRDTFLNSNPVRTPADLKNKKIRVMGVPILVDTYKALGANVTTTAWAELYSALQLGVVDGIDHIPAAVQSMKFYEILKYGSRIPLFASPMLIVVSKPMYDKLPSEYQDILVAGIKETVEVTDKLASEATASSTEFLESKGLEFITPDPTPFLEMVKPVRERYMQDLDPWVQDIVKQIETM